MTRSTCYRHGDTGKSTTFLWIVGVNDRSPCSSGFKGSPIVISSVLSLRVQKVALIFWTRYSVEISTSDYVDHRLGEAVTFDRITNVLDDHHGDHHSDQPHGDPGATRGS